MALSNTHKLFTLASNYDFYFNWERTNTNVENNASIIEWTVTVKDLNGYGLGSGAGVSTTAVSLQVNVDGTTYSFGNVAVNCPAYDTAQLAKGTSVILHSGYGAQSFTAYMNWSQFGTYINSSGNTNTTFTGVSSKTITASIDRIVRSASIKSISPDNPTDEDIITITYSNPAGSYATLLQAGMSFSKSDTNMVIPFRDIPKTSTSYPFEFSETELADLYTVLDDRVDFKRMFIVLKSIVPTDTVPEEVIEYKEFNLQFIEYKPKLKVTLKDTSLRALDATDNEKIFIRGVSEVQFDLGSQVFKGATLANQWIQNGDDLLNQKTGYLIEVQDDTFYAYVEDNRGYFDAKTIVIGEGEWSEYRWIPYFPLTCKVNNPLLDANGNTTVTISGKYFQGNFGAKANSMRMEYLMMEEGATYENWSAIQTIFPTVDSEGNYTYTFTISGLNYTSRYNLSVRVIDEVMTETVQANTIVGAIPVFDWGKDDFAFYVPVYINGALVPSVVDQGTYGIWTYRKWSDGTSECWGQKDFAVTFGTSTWGGMYTSGAISGSNVTFPSGLFNSTPNIQASLLTRSIGGILMAPGGAGSNIASKSQTGVYEICRGNTTGGDYTICYQVKGRWK